ncbi:MAG TPA: ribosome small subunit-dependent GTPase A [Actinobacteria bacterium]|nr:ribosome small subunit-dependent GTPase A [Actinomycetota bacterium]
MNLNELGWDKHFSEHFESLGRSDFLQARVLIETARIYSVFCASGELSAEVSGKLVHKASGRQDFPVVGDWVAVKPSSGERKATIHDVLPRKSAFIRKEAGKRTEAQVVAANIDTVFMVCGLDGDFNPSRIERYLAVAWESGAKPVVVLNKTDICTDVDDVVKTVESVAPGIPVLPMSATENIGVDRLCAHIRFGETVAFLGSSGVGKSSLVNALLGIERQHVRDVRGDDNRGRHTTVHGQLFVLPEGGVLIDTPGLRELQLWSDNEGLARAFDDIEELSSQCRFKNCRHDTEPGCAVRQALEDGTLADRRWQSYTKLKQELNHLESRQDTKSKLTEKKRKKDLSMHIKRVNKRRRT